MSINKHEDILEGVFDRQYEKLLQLDVATLLIKGISMFLTAIFNSIILMFYCTVVFYLM